jgi:hypothetical protein
MSPSTTTHAPSSVNPSKQVPFQTQEEIDAFDKSMTEDPAALVSHMGDIMFAVEDFCMSDVESGNFVWCKLKGLLEEINAKREEKAKKLASKHPRSPVCPRKPLSFVNVHGEEWYVDVLRNNDGDAITPHKTLASLVVIITFTDLNHLLFIIYLLLQRIFTGMMIMHGSRIVTIKRFSTTYRKKTSSRKKR